MIVLCEGHTVLTTSTCASSEVKQPEIAANLVPALEIRRNVYISI